MAPTVLSCPLYALVFLIAVLTIAAPQIVRIARQRSNADGQVRDRGSKRVLVITAAVGWLVEFRVARTLPAATIPWARPLVFGAGIAFVLCGASIRWYAIRTLGGFFTDVVMIQAGQNVVSTGPYRWVRHPSYAGGLVSRSQCRARQLGQYRCRSRSDSHRVLLSDTGRRARSSAGIGEIVLWVRRPNPPPTASVRVVISIRRDTVDRSAGGDSDLPTVRTRLRSVRGNIVEASEVY